MANKATPGSRNQKGQTRLIVTMLPLLLNGSDQSSLTLLIPIESDPFGFEKKGDRV